MKSEQDVSEIAKALIEGDEYLISNWKRFYRSLGDLEAGKLYQLTWSYNNQTIETHDLFVHIINEWAFTALKCGKKATIGHLIEVLRQEGFNGAAERLMQKLFYTQQVCPELNFEGSFQPPIFNSYLKQQSKFLNEAYSSNLSDEETIDQTIKIPNQQIWFEVGRSTHNFIGRDNEIDRINQIFLQKTTLLLTIVGMGGVGKSELVKKISRNFYNEHKSNCIWLNAETSDSFKNSIIRLTQHQAIVQNKRQSKVLQKDLYNNIVDLFSKVKRRTIFIIDNLDNSIDSVSQFLIRIENPKFFVIVTTRSLGALDGATNILKLDVLQRNEAKKLITNSMVGETEELVDQLCTQLQDFPLALQQAIAFITTEKLRGVKGQSYSVLDYLSDYQRQTSKLLDFPLNKFEHEYNQTTLITWNISIDKIKLSRELGLLAIDILNHISYLDADRIPIDLICRLIAPSKVSFIDEHDHLSRIHEAIKLIKEYSLIKVENYDVSIHRLVQEVIRLSLDTSVLTCLLSSISQNISTFNAHDMVHVLSAWRFGQQHRPLIKRFNTLMFTLSEKLRNLKLFSDMHKFVLENIKLLEDILGYDHVETRRMRRQNAEALFLRGEVEQAIKVWTIEYDNLKVKFGDNFSETIETSQRIQEATELLNKYKLAATSEDLQEFIWSSQSDTIQQPDTTNQNVLPQQIVAKQNPIFYNMGNLKADLKGREVELLLMNKLMQEQLDSKLFNPVLLTGLPYIGKSELVRHFAFKLYTENSISCIFIDGSQIETQITNFVMNELRLPNTELQQLSKAVVENCLDKWLLVFDGVEASSIVYLKSLMDILYQFPCSHFPFVVITARVDELLEFQLFPLSYVKLNDWPPVADIPDMYNFLKFQVTPWVLEQSDIHHSASQLIEVCSVIDGFFNELEKHKVVVQELNLIGFQLLILLGFFEWSTNIYELLKNYWEAFELEMTDNNLPIIVEFCSEGLIVKISGIEIKCYDLNLRSIVKTRYFKHPGLTVIISELIVIWSDKNCFELLRWLLRSYIALKEHERPSSNGILENILSRVIEHTNLVKEFESEISELYSESWSFELLKRVYQCFVTISSETSVYSIKLGRALAIRTKASEVFSELVRSKTAGLNKSQEIDQKLDMNKIIETNETTKNVKVVLADEEVNSFPIVKERINAIEQNISKNLTLGILDLNNNKESSSEELNKIDLIENTNIFKPKNPTGDTSKNVEISYNGLTYVRDRFRKKRVGSDTIWFSKTADTVPSIDEFINLIKSEITPLVIERFVRRGKNVEKLCSKIVFTFEKLTEFVLKVDILKKLSIGWLLIISYALDKGTEIPLLYEYYRSLLIRIEIDEDQILDLFEIFSTSGLIYLNLNKRVQLINKQLKHVLKYYLKYPKIITIVREILGTEIKVNKVSISWLLFSTDFDECTYKLAFELFEHNLFVESYKHNSETKNPDWSLEVLKLKFRHYIKLSDKFNKEPETVGVKLAAEFGMAGMFREGGELFRILYEFRKGRYGYVNNLTLYAGDYAADSFMKARLNLEAIKIQREMAANCVLEFSPSNPATLFRQWDLAFTIDVVDRQEALKILRNILPICKRSIVYEDYDWVTNMVENYIYYSLYVRRT